MKNLLLKLVGYEWTYYQNDNTHKMKWGEFSWHSKKWKCGLRLNADGYDYAQIIFQPLFFSMFIKLPFQLKKSKEESYKDRSYGFYLYGEDGFDCINFEWNYSRWHWRFPFFSWEWESREVLDFNRNTVYIKSDNKDTEHDWNEEERLKKSVSKTYDYTYVRKNGQIQDRKATVFIERWTWGRKWFPFLKMKRTSIDVAFNEEIGERVDTWKGGTVGCSWELKPNETPEQALRRMERERKFK